LRVCCFGWRLQVALACSNASRMVTWGRKGWSMACCGQRRQAMVVRQVTVQDRAQVFIPPVPSSTNLETVWLVFSGDTGIVVKGQVSQRVYFFEPHPQALEVDARDAPALLLTGHFLRSG
jgi:hypothetical protein